MVLPDGNTIDWTGEFLEVVPDKRLVLTMTDPPGEPGEPGRPRDHRRVLADHERTQLHMTQEAPDFTDSQRTATIAGWQTFLDVLQQIAEAARAGSCAGRYRGRAPGR